ncbi:protein disulfide-isomerase [Clonorchis sinensis]|uniref:Protein disulfide-isomerase n=1 Tax=Clonorchis sinensis TaxID=79923 RepID=G7Y9W3_CLOSI|nr:protein disulfide-isomerase [Clonorchis sinensis]
MYNLRSKSCERAKTQSPLGAPFDAHHTPSTSQVNRVTSPFFVSPCHCPPKSSKASSIRSNRFPARQLDAKLERDVLEGDLAESLRQLEISKKKVECKRKALASLRLESHQSYSSEDELQSDDTSTKQKAGALEDTFIRDKVSLQSLISTMALPKIETDKFDGTPRKFWKFMKSFQVNVASRLADDTQRLMYLIHYCTGEAKAAIEDCVLLPESDGFVKAMDILHKEFGRAHDIAQSFIDSILVGGPIAAEDTDALRKLVREMHSCEIALTQMGYTADLNCSTNLKRIVMRLPRHLQREWAKVADNILYEQKEPSFRQLNQFLERTLSAATNVYGQLASGAYRVSSRGVDDIIRRSKLPRPHVNAVVASNCSFLLIMACTQVSNEEDSLRFHLMYLLADSTRLVVSLPRVTACFALLLKSVSHCSLRYDQNSWFRLLMLVA